MPKTVAELLSERWPGPFDPSVFTVGQCSFCGVGFRVRQQDPLADAVHRHGACPACANLIQYASNGRHAHEHFKQLIYCSSCKQPVASPLGAGDSDYFRL